MSNVLSPEEIAQFERDGYLSPVRGLSDAEVRHYRDCLENFERKHPEHLKKLKSKSHLLCPWVVEMAEHPHLLDIFEDLVGPDILCWSMAWRIKSAESKTFAGWHQDSAYFSVQPILVFGALALSDCGTDAGCLRVIPGSHKWPLLPHQDTEDPDSILARGQYISADFDRSAAVDLALKPGEIALINHAIVHSSTPNQSRDRRILLLVEMMPTKARDPNHRGSAMLVRGVDRYRNFEEDPRPDAELSPQALANWKRMMEFRAKQIFDGSKLLPSEAYGGTRPAT